jgi:hypothetical protein
MQLPPSTSSADPSLAALLFPGAPSSSPMGGPLAAVPLGAEPSSLGFEQLFAELQPAPPVTVANDPKANVPNVPVLPAKADPSAFRSFPGAFRPSPVAITQADAAGLATRVSARTGLVAPVAKDLKDVSGSRIPRLQSDPATQTQSGPLDGLAAQSAVLATAVVLPVDPLPAAILPVSQSAVSTDAELPDDPSASPDSSDLEPLTPDEGRSVPVETSRFDAVVAAVRRAPFGLGNAMEQQGKPLSVASPKPAASSETDNGSAPSAPVMPDAKPAFSPAPLGASPAFGSRDSSTGLPLPAIVDGRVVREIAPGRASGETAETAVNGLMTARMMSGSNSRETGRVNLPVDPSRPHQAKFAEVGLIPPIESKGAEKLVDKTFLSTQGKEVVDVDPAIGTAVAKSQSAMVSFTNGTQTYTVSDQSGSVVSAVSEVGDIRAESGSSRGPEECP